MAKEIGSKETSRWHKVYEVNKKCKQCKRFSSLVNKITNGYNEAPFNGDLVPAPKT